MASPDPAVLNALDPYASRSAMVIGMSLTTLCLTTAFMIVRGASLWDIGKFERDDGFLIIAYIFNIASIAIILVQEMQGVLVASEPVSAIYQVGVVITQEGLALELFYCITVFLAKAGVLLQLIRVFAPLKKGPVYIVCTALIGVNLVFYLGSGVAVLLQCKPLSKLWDPLAPGSCDQRMATLIATGALNVLSDAVIFILPLATLWRLDAKTKYRPDVMGVFATAGLAMVASVGRLVWSCFLLAGADLAQLLVGIELWTMAETALLVICPSFLFVPRFIRILRGQSRCSTLQNGEGTTSRDPDSSTMARTTTKSMPC